MPIQTCYLDIDSKPYSFEVEGDFSWGEDVNTFIHKDNIISRTSWLNEGYTIVNKFFADSNEFSLFYNEVRRNIIFAMKQNNVTLDESEFKLEDYHKYVKDDNLHNNIINLTRNLSDKDFSLNLINLLSVSEDVLSYKLSTIVEEIGKVHIQLRISRPNSLDINPPHKDGYLSYWRDIINIWIPISGCNSQTSLPILPGSHLWPENYIYKTQNKGAKINGFKYHVPCILNTLDGKIKMIRPNPKQGEAIFFTPFLIHGAAFNNSESTRVGMELRFPKK